MKQERVEILSHHIENCLKPYLEGAPLSKVPKIVVSKIIPSMEDIEMEDLTIYPFLKDPDLRQKYIDALTVAGMSYITNNFSEIPDWDEDGNLNNDLICHGCGNFTDNKCLLEDIFGK